MKAIYNSFTHWFHTGISRFWVAPYIWSTLQLILVKISPLEITLSTCKILNHYVWFYKAFLEIHVTIIDSPKKKKKNNNNDNQLII